MPDAMGSLYKNPRYIFFSCFNQNRIAIMFARMRLRKRGASIKTGVHLPSIVQKSRSFSLPPVSLWLLAREATQPIPFFEGAQTGERARVPPVWSGVSLPFRWKLSPFRLTFLSWSEKTLDGSDGREVNVVLWVMPGGCGKARTWVVTNLKSRTNKLLNSCNHFIFAF